MLVRGIEDEVLPTCQRHGIGVITWAPLAGGWLSGRIRDEDSDPGSRTASRLRNADLDSPALLRKLDAVDRLTVLARDEGLELARMALAWATEHPVVSSVLIGPRREDQLTSMLDAVDLKLDPAILDAIDAIVEPGTNLMHDDGGRDWLYGRPVLRDVADRRQPRSKISD